MERRYVDEEHCIRSSSKMNEENLSNLFLAKALDSMGMYPQATISGDVRTERTPWQEGWNEALMKLTNRWVAIEEWYKTINKSIKPVLSECLLTDLMFLHVNGDKISILVNMNDTFAYACADAEEVDIIEVQTVKDIYDRFIWDGVIAWAANKRKVTPIEERITTTYKMAREFLETTQPHKAMRGF
jgi:hypothetical protein